MSAIVEVRELSFSYPGSARPAVAALDFDIRRGEIFGFLGPNGAGKSTTQRILTGLLRGWSGHASVLGGDLRQQGSAYYERIGVSFEFPNHYLKLTALENLTYFGALYRGPTRRPRELLERLGLEADSGTRVSQFSKGMMARLTLARSLINDPELWFLDEPTTGLDPVNARRVRELIREQRAAGRTVFLTTHDMTVAGELCDRVAFLVEGRIAAIDTPRALELAHGRRRVVVEYREAGELQRREFPLEGLGDNGEFLALLRRGAVETIHTQEATLEDVFIAVTGRSLA